jgi:SAM-dependent methyltransferase
MDPFIVVAGLVGVLAYVAWRRRAPRPFPSWLTPLLHSPLRKRAFSPEAAARRHGVAPGMNVLEVGPGDGYLTVAAVERSGPGGRHVCLDVQLAMLRKLRRALGARTPALVCASGSQLPFRAGSFDLVFLSHVLGEIPDREGALREYARVLQPNGTLAVTEGLPDPDFIRCARLVRMAHGAGFRPGERFGRTLHYTQRFALGENAAS